MSSPGGPRSDEYGALVVARKACRICVERSPGKIRSCAEFDFDPDVVSHWEAWLGHKRPKLLAVGQDFGNVGYFVRNRGRDDPYNQTNANLRKLLIEAGFTATDPAELDRDTPVFLTNSILCIKEGPMDGAVRSSWVNVCADKHLHPLVRYLKTAGRCRDGQLRLAGGAPGICIGPCAGADFACRRFVLGLGRRDPRVRRRPPRPAGAYQPLLAAAGRRLAADRPGSVRG